MEASLPLRVTEAALPWDLQRQEKDDSVEVARVGHEEGRVKRLRESLGVGQTWPKSPAPSPAHQVYGLGQVTEIHRISVSLPVKRGSQQLPVSLSC